MDIVPKITISDILQLDKPVTSMHVVGVDATDCIGPRDSLHIIQSAVQLNVLLTLRK
jgi:hypothetical protein